MHTCCRVVGPCCMQLSMDAITFATLDRLSRHDIRGRLGADGSSHEPKPTQKVRKPLRSSSLDEELSQPRLTSNCGSRSAHPVLLLPSGLPTRLPPAILKGQSVSSVVPNLCTRIVWRHSFVDAIASLLHRICLLSLLRPKRLHRSCTESFSCHVTTLTMHPHKIRTTHSVLMVSIHTVQCEIKDSEAASSRCLKEGTPSDSFCSSSGFQASLAGLPK